jgi:hypothetical protein
MTASRIMPTYTVQPAAPSRMPKSLYIVVFALSTVGAYWWATAGKTRLAARQQFTSTAWVHIHQGAAVKLDCKGVRRQVLSKENLARAAGEIHNSASPGGGGEDAAAESPARLREKTAVELSVGGPSGAADVAIRSSSESPSAAAQWVNALANSYADGYRRQWRSDAGRVSQSAQAATAAADAQLRRATARLDGFVRDHLKPRQQASPAPGVATTPPVPAAQPVLVDNPDWVALNRQLDELLQQRAKLLVDRTPIHPEVQQVEIRIAEAQQRLSETKRWIAGPPSRAVSAPSRAADQPAAQAAGPAEDPAATAATREKLKAAVAAAQGAKEEAQRRQDRARQAWQQEPRVEVQLAVAQAVPPPPLALRLRLALAALAAGLTATIGLGMVAAGAAIEPAVRSVAQLRAILSVPVLGVVSETGSTQAARPVRPNLSRLLWIAAGAIVIAACLAAVVLSGK